MVLVIITGGGGFLGQCLASSILSSPSVCLSEDESTKSEVTKLILADVAFPETFQPKIESGIKSGLVECRQGSIADATYCQSLFPTSSDQQATSTPVSVFHLGAVMSGTGESDFDLCMNVNLHGMLNMLEASRTFPSRVRFVYASAGATIGSGSPTDYISKEDTITDSARATPHTTYGMTKGCGELLLADYSRRKFVDGRGARLPTIVVRAGLPNAATTGCFSGIVREQLGGIDATMPIAPHVEHAVTGVKNAVQALRRLHDASPTLVDTILGFDRTVFLPATALSLSHLDDATKRVVDPSTHNLLGKVMYEVDEFLSDVVGGFPTKIDAGRAIEIGIIPAPTAEDIVRGYAESFPDALTTGLKLVPRHGAADVGNDTTTANSANDCTNNNLVAVVTGAGSGIGRAVALRLSEGKWGPRKSLSDTTPNVCIVLVGRRRGPLQETAALVAEQAESSSTSATTVSTLTLVAPCDVTDQHAVRTMFARTKTAFGRVDLLFNNAGTNIGRTDAVDFDVVDFRRIVDANLTGSFLCAREAMKVMAKQSPRGGRIINNGSVSADRPRPGGIAYTASKHGVTGLTKTLALEGRSLGVAVGQVDFGNVTSAVSDITQTGGGALQADGSLVVEPQMLATDAAGTVVAMAALPLEANVLQMTVMATDMPLVGRG